MIADAESLAIERAQDNESPPADAFVQAVAEADQDRHVAPMMACPECLLIVRRKAVALLGGSAYLRLVCDHTPPGHVLICATVAHGTIAEWRFICPAH